MTAAHVLHLVGYKAFFTILTGHLTDPALIPKSFLPSLILTPPLFS